MSYKVGSDAWTQNVKKSALDNHANQMNPNNRAYWASRGMEMPGSTPACDSGSGSSNRLAITAIVMAGAALAGVAAIAFHKFFGRKDDADEDYETEEIEAIELDDDEEEE